MHAIFLLPGYLERNQRLLEDRLERQGFLDDIEKITDTDDPPANQNTSKGEIVNDEPGDSSLIGTQPDDQQASNDTKKDK